MKRKTIEHFLNEAKSRLPKGEVAMQAQWLPWINVSVLCKHMLALYDYLGIEEIVYFEDGRILGVVETGKTNTTLYDTTEKEE